MSTAATKQNIIVKPSTRYFLAGKSGDGEYDFSELLKSQKDTKPIRITSVKEVLFGPTGLMQNRYRITTTALSQLCQVIAPGLSSLLLNLFGVKGRVATPDEEYSVDAAVRILNDVVKLRFNLLENRRLVIDKASGVVQGLVGSTYRFYSNYRLYERVKMLAGDDLKFHSAAITGRRIHIWLQKSKYEFAIATPTGKQEPFYAGWYFSNSELGDCKIKGTATLFRSWSKTGSMVPITSSSGVVHLVTDKFDSKLSALFEEVRNRSDGLATTQKYLLRARTLRLGEGKKANNVDAVVNPVRKAMIRLGLSLRVANEALAHAILNGSYKEDRLEHFSGDESAVTSEMWQAVSDPADRTLFDVYNALGHVAKNYSPTQREQIESAAFRLLTTSKL